MSTAYEFINHFAFPLNAQEHKGIVWVLQRSRLRLAWDTNLIRYPKACRNPKVAVLSLCCSPCCQNIFCKSLCQAWSNPLGLSLAYEGQRHSIQRQIFHSMRKSVQTLSGYDGEYRQLFALYDFLLAGWLSFLYIQQMLKSKITVSRRFVFYRPQTVRHRVHSANHNSLQPKQIVEVWPFHSQTLSIYTPLADFFTQRFCNSIKCSKTKGHHLGADKNGWIHPPNGQGERMRGFSHESTMSLTFG